MCKINKSLTFCLFLFSLTPLVLAQNKYSSATVVFYNVENLFDTIQSIGYIDGAKSYKDPKYHISIDVSNLSKYDTVAFKEEYTYENIDGKKIVRHLALQEEFSPTGKKAWNTERYFRKINNISNVISDIGKELTGDSPTIVGLCEIETKKVVEDLSKSDALKKYNYEIVHFNSFDARGIDVALMYKKNRFVVKDTKPHPIFIYNSDGNRKYTRDILQVTGLLDGEEITFLVNHWPSRAGGEKASMPGRMEASKVLKSIFDDLKIKNPNAKIIAMGDFNDDPISPSIKNIFHPVGEVYKVKEDSYYNPMLYLYKKGVGTLAYKDAWNIFDQFIITPSLTTSNIDYSTYKIFKTEVFDIDCLKTKEGLYKGYPNRMYSGDTYNPDGYSDHFPIYTILLKEVK